jgi:hypothetical protein
VPQEQLATKIDSDVLASLRGLAQKEGRNVDTLVEEALRDLIQKHQEPSPRPHVTAAYEASHKKFATLYKKLAE